jgi:PAS domain S-box-containing protein
MKGKAQISGDEMVMQLIKRVREEVDKSLKKGENTELSGLLKTELRKLIREIEDGEKNPEQNHNSEINKNFQNDISKAGIIDQIELSTDAIWLIDSDYNIVSSNKIFKESYTKLFKGKSRVGINLFDLLPEEDRVKWKERYDKALDGEQLTVFDEFNIGNQNIYIETVLNPLRTEDGIVGISCFAKDITEKKQTEVALFQSKERYKTLLSSIPSVFYRCLYNKERTMEIISDEIERLSGYPANQFINNHVRSFISIIHPNDRNYVENIVSQCGVLKKSFELEYRLVHTDGSIRWVMDKGRAQYDEKGNVIKLDGFINDITKRKKAELDLRTRTKELYSIFDNTPVLLILAEQSGEIINVNQPTSRFGSQNQQEILKQLSSEAINCILSVKQSNSCGKGESCKNCVVKNTFIDTVREKRNFRQVEGRMIVNLDEKELERQVLISTSYIDFENSKRVLLSLDDITELSSAQEQVRKLSAAVEQSTATIVITDINGNIEYANPEFEKTTGFSIDQVIGKNPRILKSPKTKRETYSELWKTILSGETWQGEFLNVKKDGTEYWENAIISPVFNYTGEMISFIAVKDDITERKQIQQELINSEKELRQLNDEKSRYFSILAHDLRGLVGAFYGYTNLLSSEFESFTKDEIKEQIDILLKSAQDALTLLDNLLEWARASLGSLVITFIDLNLHAEVRSVVDYLYDLAKSKGIDLKYEIDREIIMLTDKNIINTIIRNLIGNAIKFTPSGGEINVTASILSNEMIEISVEDTGVGMDSDTLERLFKAGEKIVRHGTNNEKGTGLGLMICQEMVKRLGGSIYVESELGKGSRFYFRLPLKEQAE